MYLNQHQLIGYVGDMPDFVELSNGIAANFSVATTRYWRNKENENEIEEKTDWHRIVAFGKIAEKIKDRVAKGSRIFIQGRVQTRSWEDNEGKKRYSTETICNDIIVFSD